MLSVSWANQLLAVKEGLSWIDILLFLFLLSLLLLFIVSECVKKGTEKPLLKHLLRSRGGDLRKRKSLMKCRALPGGRAWHAECHSRVYLSPKNNFTAVSREFKWFVFIHLWFEEHCLLDCFGDNLTSRRNILPPSSGQKSKVKKKPVEAGRKLSLFSPRTGRQYNSEDRVFVTHRRENFKRNSICAFCCDSKF
jgi:hypothetical protein